jgi:hypothetical protein
MIRVLLLLLGLCENVRASTAPGDACMVHIHARILPECVNPCLETCCAAVQTAPLTCSAAWRTESQLQIHRALRHRRSNCTGALDTCGLRLPCLFSSASTLSPCSVGQCASLFADGVLTSKCATAMASYCETSTADEGCLALGKCPRREGWYECAMRSHPSVIDDAVSTVLLLQRHARAITLSAPQYQWIAAAGCTTEAVAHRRKVQCPIAQYRLTKGNRYQGLAFDASPADLGDLGSGPVAVSLLNVFAFVAPLALVVVFWLNDHFGSEHFLSFPPPHTKE